MKVKLEKRIYDLSEKCFLKFTNKFSLLTISLKMEVQYIVSIFKRYKFPSHELFEKYNTNCLMVSVMYFILSGFNVNSITDIDYIIFN